MANSQAQKSCKNDRSFHRDYSLAFLLSEEKLKTDEMLSELFLVKTTSPTHTCLFFRYHSISDLASIYLVFATFWLPHCTLVYFPYRSNLAMAWTIWSLVPCLLSLMYICLSAPLNFVHERVFQLKTVLNSVCIHHTSHSSCYKIKCQKCFR